MKLDSKQLMQDVSINDTDLTDAMINHASLFAHYAVLNSQAQGRVDKLKLMLDLKTAKLDQSVREEMQASGVKITESAVDQNIRRNADYVRAVNALNEAKENATLTHSALDAFRQRRDMLVQLGVAAREEAKGQVRVAAGSGDHSFAERLERMKNGAAWRGNSGEDAVHTNYAGAVQPE